MTTSWADVASKAIDFLQKPSGLGVFLVCVIILGGVYAYPMWVLRDSNQQNTEQLASRFEKAIARLELNCKPSVAMGRIR